MKRHTNKALVSLALIVSMLLSLLPNLPQATATDLTAAPTQEAAVLPEKSPVYQLDASCKLLSYVDEAVFAEGNHIARLPSEETLSSYAFLNSDGTKTVYYMNEAVKFIDADGAVVEKDITLTAATGGYTTTRNDIQLTIPNTPTSGIRLTYGGKYVTLIPEGGVLSTAPQATDSSVTYPNYFGTGMSLVYTPTLSGVKEDIVLESYTGVNSFTFTLNTNGLNMYQSNGRYYLAEGKTATRRYELGDVVAFDARGRFSVGTMAVTTVMPGQAYRITITTDEDFLTDPETVYPVAIDPTIGVSDNTHGAGAIEDTTIYQGRPTANGNWTYLHCGYYSSTYTVARTLFRLTGLTSDATYQSMSANDIVSANFYVREATGTATLDIKLLANTGSAAWTESGATWNNSGVVLGTEYARASAKSNSETVFNITNLVKNWKVNPQNAAKGFVLVSTNESTLDKAFYSSEFATTGYRPFVMVTYNLNTNPPVADGVYRIISKSANKPIGAAQSIANGTSIATQNTYTESALEMFQLWKITHLANGLYSVRPLHKLTMALHTSGTDVSICETSTIDTIVSIPTIARWQIQETTNGYTFQQLGNPNATMMAATSETGSGVDICIGTYSASSAQCHFELSPVEDTQGALFLFNTSNNTYTSSLSSGMPTVTVGVGSQKTLAEIGYTLSICDPYDTSQSVVWSSSHPAVAIVNRDTGTITPLSTGETTISAARTIEDTYHIVNYKLVVEFLDGTYYIRNAGKATYVDAGSNVGANTTPSLANYNSDNTNTSSSQRWIFTHLGNSIFTIRPLNSTDACYLGVGNQGIVLKTVIDNTTKWRVSKSAGSEYTLSPLSNSTLFLGYSSVDQSVLQLQTDSETWYLDQHNSCGLNVYFDYTHLARRYQNVTHTTNEILGYLETVRAEYLELFNIQLYFNAPELYETYANEYNCQPTTENATCPHGDCVNSLSWYEHQIEDYHHTNIYNILFQMPQPIAPKHATVLYIGHYYCYISSRHVTNTTSMGMYFSDPNKNDTIDFDPNAVVIASYLEHKANKDHTRSLMHEVGHLFNAPDHYPNSGEYEDAEDANDQLDSELFNDYCIYGKYKTDSGVTANLTICAGCQKIIRENANKYHELSLILEGLQ